MAPSGDLATILAALLRDEGEAVLDRRSQLLAALRERAPGEPRDVHLLMTAFDAGVPFRLRESVEPLGEMELGQETAHIVDGFGTSPDHARRAVDMWAKALKRLPVQAEPPPAQSPGPISPGAGFGLAALLPPDAEAPAADSILAGSPGAGAAAPDTATPRLAPGPRPLPLPGGGTPVLPLPPSGGPIPVQRLPGSAASVRPLPLPTSAPSVRPSPLPGVGAPVQPLPPAAGSGSPRPLPLPGQQPPAVRPLPSAGGPHVLPLPGTGIGTPTPDRRPWFAAAAVVAAIAGGLWAAGILPIPGGRTPPAPEPSPARPAGSATTTDEGFPIADVANPPKIQAQRIDRDPNTLLFAFGLVFGGESYTYQAAVAFPAGQAAGAGLIKVFKAGKEASTDQLTVQRSLESNGYVGYTMSGLLKGAVAAPSICVSALAGRTAGQLNLADGGGTFCAFRASPTGVCDGDVRHGCGDLVE